MTPAPVTSCNACGGEEFSRYKDEITLVLKSAGGEPESVGKQWLFRCVACGQWKAVPS
jgi:hypothetical protein